MNIEKLPKWAQGYIKDLESQREAAIRKLNEMCDNQTPSPIYVDDWACTGEDRGPTTKRQYIQAYKISFDYAGLTLDVTCFNDQVKLQWQENGHSMNEIAMIPEAYQTCRLVCKKDMR